MKDLFDELADKAMVKIAVLNTVFEEVDIDPNNISIPDEWVDMSNMALKGKMKARTIAQRDGYFYIACLWEKGTVMKPHKHPDVHEHITMISGVLKDQVTKKSIEGKYTIQANKPHIIEALTDCIFIIMFSKIQSENEKY
ncbi:MAG: hypothetical protein ACPGJS_20065 [Flammeovirgaceae bacterium]